VRRTAGRRLAYRSETEESLRDGRWQSRALECRAARQHRQGWQRCWSAALCVRTGWVAVRTMLMGGMILRRVHMVVTRGHRTRGHRGNGKVEITEDERQMPIDWREHESGGNQSAQEQKPEDEQSGPAWSLNVAHPFHRWAYSGTAGLENFRQYSCIFLVKGRINGKCAR
jgi:hypothetical protein